MENLDTVGMIKAQGSGLSDPAALREMMAKSKVPEAAKVAEVSRQFEAVMLRQVLEQSLSPVFKGMFDQTGAAHEMYRYFQADTLADAISSGGGFGLSPILESQVANKPGKGTD